MKVREIIKLIEKDGMNTNKNRFFQTLIISFFIFILVELIRKLFPNLSLGLISEIWDIPGTLIQGWINLILVFLSNDGYTRITGLSEIISILIEFILIVLLVFSFQKIVRK